MSRGLGITAAGPLMAQQDAPSEAALSSGWTLWSY